MAELSPSARRSLPDSAFAIPEKRKYPVHDEAHARNALARVAAYGTPSEKKRVYAAVRSRYPGLWRRHEDYRGEKVVLRKIESPRGRVYYHVRWHPRKKEAKSA